MSRDKMELIEPADAQQVAQWAAELGTTPHALRAVIPIVGRSAGALHRHFKGPLAMRSGTQAFFARVPLAKELADLFSRLNGDPTRADSLAGTIAPLLGKMIRGIQQGEIRLDYLPAEDDLVVVPPPDSDLYMQALLYWRIRLQQPIPLILEAVASAEPEPTVPAVVARLAELQGREAKGSA